MAGGDCAVGSFLSVIALVWIMMHFLICLVFFHRYILYKQPNSFEFIYTDSTRKAAFQKNKKPINHQVGVLARTLDPVFSDVRTFLVIFFLGSSAPVHWASALFYSSSFEWEIKSSRACFFLAQTLTCPTCGYVAYNDQPPVSKPTAKEKCGHSKGWWEKKVWFYGLFMVLFEALTKYMKTRDELDH